MINWKYKKAKKQIGLWDFIPSRPSSIKFETTGAKDLSDYLVPLNKIQPEWFSSLKTTKDYFNSHPNVRVCPSFIELFKNSYAFVAPCDFQIKVTRTGFDMIQTEEGWINISTHTALPQEIGGSQMGPQWDAMHQNIKIMTGLQLGCNEGHYNIMYLPAYYHDPNARLFAPPGVSTVTDSIPLDFNLNLFINISALENKEEEVIKVKCGTPLAYVYFPFGLLDFQQGNLSKKMRKTFIGDYNKQLDEYKNSSTKGKCPFSFLH